MRKWNMRKWNKYISKHIANIFAVQYNTGTICGRSTRAISSSLEVEANKITWTKLYYSLHILFNFLKLQTCSRSFEVSEEIVGWKRWTTYQHQSQLKWSLWSGHSECFYPSMLASLRFPALSITIISSKVKQVFRSKCKNRRKCSHAFLIMVKC
jgi:hypothetical protein